MFVPHRNPPARIETIIKHYKAYSLTRAYSGETFYWGLVPQAGDTITWNLTPPVPLEGFRYIYYYKCHDERPIFNNPPPNA